MLAVLKSLTLLAILLFFYGGKSVCQKPVRPKPAKILRNNLVVTKNNHLGLVSNTWTTKQNDFGLPTVIFFKSKSTKL